MKLTGRVVVSATGSGQERRERGAAGRWDRGGGARPRRRAGCGSRGEAVGLRREGLGRGGKRAAGRRGKRKLGQAGWVAGLPGLVLG